MTKKDFIQTLIEETKQNMWRNEEVVAYKREKDPDFDATVFEKNIETDEDYIKHLMVRLALCESSE